MLSSTVSYDEVEEFVRILDRLRPEHIHLMRILRDPIAYDEETGNPVGKGQPGGITSISQIMRKLLPDWEQLHIREIATVLEQDERLIQHIVSRYGTMLTDQGIYHLQNSLTEKGKRFCSFILEVGRT